MSADEKTRQVVNALKQREPMNAIVTGLCCGGCGCHMEAFDFDNVITCRCHNINCRFYEQPFKAPTIKLEPAD